MVQVESNNILKPAKVSITVRSKCDIKYADNGKASIILTKIPYVVNKVQLIEKITQLAKERKLMELLIYLMSLID